MKFPHLENLKRRAPQFRTRFPWPKRLTPFLKLPKNKRSDAVIRLKNEIRRQPSEYGKRFLGGFQNPPSPGEGTQSFDFRFQGKNRFTIWNAELLTAREAFLNEVRAMAWERTLSLLTIEEQDFCIGSFTVFSKKNGSESWISRSIIARPRKFNGLTFIEQTARFEDEIILNERPEIHESFQISRDDQSDGIGLQIVLDIEEINIGDVEDAIDRFISFGERDWVSTNPVPTDRLPATAPYKSFPHMEAAIDKTPITESKFLDIEKPSRNSTLIFSIKNIRFGANRLYGNDKIWMADLEFLLPDKNAQLTFEDIFFTKHDGKFFFHDFQSESEDQLIFHHDLAPKQDRFFRFLHNENRSDQNNQDLKSLLLKGQKQLTSGRGTPAILYREDPSPVLAFAYQDNTGRYQIIIPDLEAI